MKKLFNQAVASLAMFLMLALLFGVQSASAENKDAFNTSFGRINFSYHNDVHTDNSYWPNWGIAFPADFPHNGKAELNLTVMQGDTEVFSKTEPNNNITGNVWNGYMSTQIFQEGVTYTFKITLSFPEFDTPVTSEDKNEYTYSFDVTPGASTEEPPTPTEEVKATLNYDIIPEDNGCRFSYNITLNNAGEYTNPRVRLMFDQDGNDANDKVYEDQPLIGSILLPITEKITYYIKTTVYYTDADGNEQTVTPTPNDFDRVFELKADTRTQPSLDYTSDFKFSYCEDAPETSAFLTYTVRVSNPDNVELKAIRFASANNPDYANPDFTYEKWPYNNDIILGQTTVDYTGQETIEVKIPLKGLNPNVGNGNWIKSEFILENGKAYEGKGENAGNVNPAELVPAKPGDDKPTGAYDAYSKAEYVAQTDKDVTPAVFADNWQVEGYGTKDWKGQKSGAANPTWDYYFSDLAENDQNGISGDYFMMNYGVNAPSYEEAENGEYIFEKGEGWSEENPVGTYRPVDVNENGTHNLTDASYKLTFLTSDGKPFAPGFDYTIGNTATGAVKGCLDWSDLYANNDAPACNVSVKINGYYYPVEWREGKGYFSTEYSEAPRVRDLLPVTFGNGRTVSYQFRIEWAGSVIETGMFSYTLDGSTKELPRLTDYVQFDETSEKAHFERGSYAAAPIAEGVPVFDENGKDSDWASATIPADRVEKIADGTDYYTPAHEYVISNPVSGDEDVPVTFTFDLAEGTRQPAEYVTFLFIYTYDDEGKLNQKPAESLQFDRVPDAANMFTVTTTNSYSNGTQLGFVVSHQYSPAASGIPSNTALRIYEVNTTDGNITNGIENIAMEEVADADAPVVYYNLQGVRLNAPVAGQIMIRVQGSNVSKILVK